MKLFFLMVAFFLVTKQAFSQFDENGNAGVPSELKEPLNFSDKNSSLFKLPTNPHSLTNSKYRKGIQVPSLLIEKKKKQQIFSTKTDLLTRTIEYKPTYLNQFKDSGGRGNKKTQYLGEFSSTGKFVEIYCRDHEYVDGDRVQIMVNGKIVAQNQELTGAFLPVLVSLEKGPNRIEFKALNEGTSSPNTAEFIVYDQFGNVITHDRWNLATGVKASILVNKP